MGRVVELADTHRALGNYCRGSRIKTWVPTLELAGNGIRWGSLSASGKA